MSQSHYETSNVYLASFLRCQGADFLGFERVSERRVQFQFIADEKVHALLRLYWSSTPVPLVPLGLFGALRYFKSLIRRRPAIVAATRATKATGNVEPVIPETVPSTSDAECD